MHREILGLGRDLSVEGDHINGKRLDNRKKNLRAVTREQNLQNRNYKNPECSSKFRGVSYSNKDKIWRAEGQVGGKNHKLGSFDSEIDAAIVAQKWRDENMPYAEPDQALMEVLDNA